MLNTDDDEDFPQIMFVTINNKLQTNLSLQPVSNKQQKYWLTNIYARVYVYGKTQR